MKETQEITGEGTPLDIANAHEREIQLKGRQDPDNFKMADGLTLTETRQKLYEQQVKEGEEVIKAHTEEMRKQSTKGDPLYDEGTKVMPNSISGGATIVPSAEPTKPSEPGPGAAGGSVIEESRIE